MPDTILTTLHLPIHLVFTQPRQVQTATILPQGRYSQAKLPAQVPHGQSIADRRLACTVCHCAMDPISGKPARLTL